MGDATSSRFVGSRQQPPCLRGTAIASTGMLQASGARYALFSAAYTPYVTTSSSSAVLSSLFWLATVVWLPWGYLPWWSQVPQHSTAPMFLRNPK